MFLKVYWINKIKKVNFQLELQQFDQFTALIHKITKIAPQDQSLSFVDTEEECLQIKDALDFEYFLNVSVNATYKSINVTRISESVEFQRMETDCSDALTLPTKIHQQENKFISQKSSDVVEIPHQKINTEIRPFRQLPTYRGLDEFVHHFDHSLKLHVEVSVRENHTGVTCDICETKNMTGKRYKCLVCENFDICESCEQKDAHKEHPMIRCNKSECSKVLGKLGRKFLKYKHRAERKSRIILKMEQVQENCQAENLRNIVRHSIVPTSRRVINSLCDSEEERVQSGQKEHEQNRMPAESVEVKSESGDQLRSEKRELLRFMFVDAENEVLEELVRRLDSLNLIEFCEEIERNKRILDRF